MDSRRVDSSHNRDGPLIPIPTGIPPRGQPQSGIRAVLFDVYGTLLVSGSGELVESDIDREARVLAGLLARGPDQGKVAEPLEAVRQFHREIRRSHSAAREQGVEFPEVEIREVWRRVLGEQPSDAQIEQVAIEFEMEVHPAGPMPGAVDCLLELRGQGIVLGVVSNAQFYTPLVCEQLLGQTLEELGIDEDLAVFSYQHRRAKPGRELFVIAAERLKRQGLRAEDTLVVGNDLLNDVVTAAACGFRTALFAGDRRSLRLRDGDPRVEGVEPDVVVTTLRQLPGLLVA